MSALLQPTFAAIPRLPNLVLGLSLSDTDVLYIRVGLALFGLVLLAFVGWSLFFQTCRKLHAVKQQFAEALKRPRRFQDDCIQDERLGLYRHKTKPGFFCGSCTPKDIESPLKTEEFGWRCLKECGKFHPDPDKRVPPYSPIYRSPLDGSTL